MPELFGLGCFREERPWKNPAKEFNFHTDIPEKKKKNKSLILISGKRGNVLIKWHLENSLPV